MKKGPPPKLWIYFIWIVFAILLLTTVTMACIIVFLYRFNLLKPESGSPFSAFLFILLISIVIGTTISLFVARQIIRPITRLSKAAAEVAKGNFNVHLNEEEQVKEIGELAHSFNVMVQELSGIETLRNDFVVNVSHEFKTPIAAIEGYATLLQDQELSPSERHEYTQMIIDSSHQLATLSGNILRLSRLENQEVLLEKEIFRLDEQIRQAVLFLEPKWSFKNLDLQIELDKCNYHGNQALLMQVWLNLIENAIKFTPPEGSILLRLFQQNKSIVTEICDTGCGMEVSIQKNIFDKFYQGDSARKAEGNGLGLALVKRIVELCGGMISVESTKGKGSIFRVILPILP